jgi:hypothetical protein
LAHQPLYEIGNGRTARSGVTAVSTAHGIKFVTSQFLKFLHSALALQIFVRPRSQSNLVTHITVDLNRMSIVLTHGSGGRHELAD